MVENLTFSGDIEMDHWARMAHSFSLLCSNCYRVLEKIEMKGDSGTK